MSQTKVQLVNDVSGNVGVSTASPVAQTLAGGTAITPVLDLKGVTQNNTSGILQFTRKDNATQGSCIYSSGDDAGLTMRNTDGNGMGFYNGTTIALRIDPSGSVRIAHTSYGANTGADDLIVGNTNSGVNRGITILNHTGSDGRLCFADTNSGDGGMIKYVHASDYMQIIANGSERMRIANSGSHAEIFMNCQEAFNNAVLSIQQNGSCGIGLKAGATNNQAMLAFRNPNGEVGGIDVNGSSTSYHTSSDYRLKENQVAISDGITRLKTLKPYRFNFKADETTTVDGFFAHEVTAVPEAIKGTKDEVDSDNNPVYQGIDQSKLIPLLTAALQEEIGKREALETRVATLEAA